MKVEAKDEFDVQTRAYGLNEWESFRSFDTLEAAIEYANADMNVRVVKRTVVTISGEWEVVQ